MKWIIFIIVVVLMLALDLGGARKNPRAMGFKEAVKWTVIWIAAALVFNLGILVFQGSDPAILFFTGYLIEKSLSIDNLFVFLVVFSYFNIQRRVQHQILFWGIVGAVVMRAILISCGIALFENFHWVIYLFGAFLVFTGIKTCFEHAEKINPEKNIVIRFLKKVLPIDQDYEGDKFFIYRNRKLWVTRSFIVLCVVEATDLIFALDSIPAILGISTDPFIVYTSNLFAILGLRALYFVVAELMQSFHLLRYGVSLVLIIVGLKMLLDKILYIPEAWILAAIGITILISIVGSLILSNGKNKNKD